MVGLLGGGPGDSVRCVTCGGRARLLLLVRPLVRSWSNINGGQALLDLLQMAPCAGSGRRSLHIGLSSHKTRTQEQFGQFQDTCHRELEL